MLFDLDADPALAGPRAGAELPPQPAFVGASSSGVFCRADCTPPRAGLQPFATASAALAAGFRPCPTCDPLGAATGSDPMIQTLLRALQMRPLHPFRTGDIAALGFDPREVRHAFKRRFGLTFLELARLSRQRDGFETPPAPPEDALRTFPSTAAFRRAFARCANLPEDAFHPEALLWVDWIDTPLGPLFAIADARALHLLEFPQRRALPREVAALRARAKGALGFGRTRIHDQIAAELSGYFAGTSAGFDTPLALHGTPFTTAVWRALRQIPAGTTETYAGLAARLNRPDAARAVARANGANPFAIVVPCHRLLGATGALTGYGGGLWRKRQLLDLEQQYRMFP